MHTVATRNLGNHVRICLKTEEEQQNHCQYIRLIWIITERISAYRTENTHCRL